MSSKTILGKFSIVTLTMLVAFTTSVIAAGGRGKQRPMEVEKTSIHKNISTAAKNGADLDDVKQIFQNRKHVKHNVVDSLVSLFRGPGASINDETYIEPIDLSTVLKDIKSDYRIKDGDNLKLIESMAQLIDEHEKTSPFDKLDPSQRIHFEMIKVKLGDNYSIAQDSINRVVDELDSKNMLVNKYFSEATLSYRYSLLALVLSLGV